MLDMTVDGGARAWPSGTIPRQIDDRVPQGLARHARFLTLLSVRLIFETTARASRRLSS